MAQYGGATYRNNKVVLDPAGGGGIFVARVTFNDQYTRYTYTDLDTMTLFGFDLTGGYHNVVYGRDGSGFPYVEAMGFTPAPDTPSGLDYTTTVAVFAR
jgi:hypothetical protein